MHIFECGILTLPFEIPDKMLYPYFERNDFHTKFEL